MPKFLKITVISFDYWNYDVKIVEHLNKLGHEAQHINISRFKHKNLLERLKNTLQKIFLNKNPKHKKRQDSILETLINSEKQDYILVLNPDLIDENYHLKIKKHTNNYITYLYDSITRSKKPITHLLNGIFDKIYSFDDADVEKFGFIKTNNYIYLDKQPINRLIVKYSLINISSFDKRFVLINRIANELSQQNVNFMIVLISKNIKFKLLKFKKNIKETRVLNFTVNKFIKFQSKRISLNKVIELYKKSDIILDLIQGFQDGLSFRVFESMALQKKLITNNVAIKTYSFYNPNNILVIDTENIIIPNDFIQSAYEPITDEIYNLYTLETWVKTIFELKI